MISSRNVDNGRNLSQSGRSFETKSVKKGGAQQGATGISPAGAVKMALLCAGTTLAPSLSAAVVPPRPLTKNLQADRAPSFSPSAWNATGAQRHLLFNRQSTVFLAPASDCKVVGFVDQGLAATLQLPGQYGNDPDAYFQVLNVQQDGLVALSSYDDPSDPPSYCLDVLNGTFTYGAAVGAWECAENSNQLWHFEDVDAGIYSVSPKKAPVATNLCLDLYKGFTNQSTPLVLNGCDTDVETQKWQLKTEADIFGNGTNATPCL